MEPHYDPGPRPRAIEAHLGEIPSTLFDDRIYGCSEIADRYATELARGLVRALGIAAVIGGGAAVDEILAAGGFVPAFEPALRALLDRLVESGDLERLADDGREVFRERALREGDPASYRRAAERFGTGATASLDLLDAAAAAYPAVARGGTSGEKELFSAGRIGLWLAYFSNDNPGYVLNNTLPAYVAAHRVRASGLRILEIGAGAGSAGRALLAELERQGRLDSVATYDFTEPSPFFRRRGERELRALYPAVTLQARAVDIDLPLGEQGCEPASYDLVFGVNVLHVARDLVATLAHLRETLRPGGWLIAGECIRPFAGQSVPADLVFQLFDGFTGVDIDPETRPTHGFLQPGDWRRALAAAGYSTAEVLPDISEIRAIYPRFFTGVVCGGVASDTDSSKGERDD